MITFSQFLLLEGQLEDSLMRIGASEEDAKKAIARWRNLNDAQRKQIPNPQQYTKKKGNTFKDFIKDLESAEGVVSKTAKQKQVKQSGIKGLEEGEDYLEFETGDPEIQAYAPLHWEASKLIASKDVGSCEGKWCTAYQKSPQHWYEYIDVGGGALIYFVTPETKYAAYYETEKEWEVFTSEDKKMASSPIDDLVTQLASKFDEIREHFSPSYTEIVTNDDADSFAERYKENPEAFHKNSKNIMQGLIHGGADQCLDWVVKNVSVDTGALFVALYTVCDTDWWMRHTHGDEYGSDAMNDRFMKVFDKLPKDLVVGGADGGDGISYSEFYDLCEGIASGLHYTTLYFDTLLNDDRFWFGKSTKDRHKGTWGVWDDMLNGVADPDEDVTIDAMERLDKRREEVEGKR